CSLNSTVCQTRTTWKNEQMKYDNDTLYYEE
ncbi:unnamed protein product, partial [marine sediment metagenome]